MTDRNKSLAIHEFFGQLPKDTLSEVEKEVRDHLLAAVLAVRRLLPKTNVVSLSDWVERRIPEELDLKAGSDGRVFLTLPGLGPELSPKVHDTPAAASNSARGVLPATPKAPPIEVSSAKKGVDHLMTVASDAFFGRLPADAFTPQEDQLREALNAVLERGPVPLPDVLRDAQVSTAKKFLPHAVSLASWVEKRIGAEVCHKPNKLGEPCLELVGQDISADPARNPWFDSLPETELTPEEESLREAIVDFLATWDGGQELATLVNFAANSRIRTARQALLPAGVSLKDWITSRMGSELLLEEQAHTSGSAHAAWAVTLLPEFRKVVTDRYVELQMGKTDQERRRTDATKIVHEDGKDGFFASLPEDQLAEEEERMREALLDFIDLWTGAGRPTLSKAGVDRRVSKARADLLPKGTGVSLREWIEARIGGELTTENEDPGDINSQIVIGLRDVEYVEGNAGRKRRVRDRDSSRRGGKDKGKGKELKGGDWICTACGDHQFARNAECRKCGQAKDLNTVELKDGQWICSACGEHQFARNVECRKCGKPKSEDAEAEPAVETRRLSRSPKRGKGRDKGKGKEFKEGDWICATCGDHQFASRAECRKCGQPKSADVVAEAEPEPEVRRFSRSRSPKKGRGKDKGKGKEMKGGDWLCPACGDHQFARNTSCRKCGADKPEDADADLEDTEGRNIDFSDYGSEHGEAGRKRRRKGKGKGSASGEKAALVDRVKAFQRRSDEDKRAWSQYCKEELGDVKDPARHSDDVLMSFLEAHENNF